MKKYFMVCVMSLAVCTSAQAILSQEYDGALDEWQKIYPIIKQVREEALFKQTSRRHLEQHSSALEVFKMTLKEVIPVYIKKMQLDQYFYFVEGLDPVYRDAFGLARVPRLLPTVGSDMYKVHDLFTSSATVELIN